MRIIEGFFDFLQKKEIHIEIIEEVIFDSLHEYFQNENFEKKTLPTTISNIIKAHGSVVISKKELDSFKTDSITFRSIMFSGDYFKLFYMSDINNCNIILLKIFSVNIGDATYLYESNKFIDFIRNNISNKYKVKFQDLKISAKTLTSDIVIEI